jgi:hypothetical protein
VATIASLLRDHVTLRVRSVDRLFLQAYVPRLMTSFQVVRFLLDRGFTIPSPALLAKIGRAYVAAIDRYAADNAITVLRFAKGESKEQIARRYFPASFLGEVQLGAKRRVAAEAREGRKQRSQGCVGAAFDPVSATSQPRLKFIERFRLADEPDA